MLTEQLKKSLLAKHELFCWHDDLLKKQSAFDKAKVAHDAFTKSRRRDFLREAEEVAEIVGTTTTSATTTTAQ